TSTTTTSRSTRSGSAAREAARAAGRPPAGAASRRTYEVNRSPRRRGGAHGVSGAVSRQRPSSVSQAEHGITDPAPTYSPEANIVAAPAREEPYGAVTTHMTDETRDCARCTRCSL